MHLVVTFCDSIIVPWCVHCRCSSLAFLIIPTKTLHLAGHITQITLWYTTSSLHRCVHATVADHMPQSPYPCITASVPRKIGSRHHCLDDIVHHCRNHAGAHGPCHVNPNHICSYSYTHSLHACCIYNQLSLWCLWLKMFKLCASVGVCLFCLPAPLSVFPSLTSWILPL